MRDPARKSPSGRKPAPAQPAIPTTGNQQPAAEVLISAARQRARGVSWALIAEETPYSEGDLLTFALDHPEIWGPLYARAEKLRLQETAGGTLAHLTALLKGDDSEASEKAARELLIHRRHVERRRRGGCSRAKPRDLGFRNSECGTAQSAIRDPQSAMAAEGTPQYPEWLVEEPAPAELGKRITYAANRVAHGEPYASIAGEVGRDAEDVARWAFIYPRAWDRVYPQARLAAAQFAAALAINRLLDLAAGPDAALAARAARTLLVHRRHMHWARLDQPQRLRDLPAAAGTEEDVSLDAAGTSSRTDVLLRDQERISVPQCLCGESSCRIRDGPG